MKFGNLFERKPVTSQTPDAGVKSEKIDLKKIPPDKAFEYVRRLEQNALHEREQKVAKYGPHYAGLPPKELIEIDCQLEAIRKVGFDLRWINDGGQLGDKPATVAGLLEKYETELNEDREFDRKLQEEGKPASNAAIDHSARMVAILKGLER